MRLAVFSAKLAQLPYLKAFLGVDEILLNPAANKAETIDLVAGWGAKANTARARRFAERHQLPYVSLEDGFLRSVGLGRKGAVGISLILDRAGVYYDATRPSDLENLLNGDGDWFTPEKGELARQAIEFMLANKLSKYNGGADFPTDDLPEGQRVLIVDQVAGDASLTLGLAETRLTTILDAAIAENPDATIFVKLHPETVAGCRRGLFSEQQYNKRVRFITGDFNPHSVIEPMDKVYVATSQMGFDALLQGKEVVCFGMPFYAGWGLTDDRVACSRRTARRGIEEVFAAAFIEYTRYVNPVTGRRCGIMEALRHLDLQTRMEQLNRANVYCFGIRHWTRVNVKPFLQSSRNKIRFVKTVAEARKAGIRKGDQVVIWGTRRPKGLDQLLQITQNPPLAMEDGFLRSVGLGSDFVRPSSLVLDPNGIYFDPARPSLLENLLNASRFPESLLNKAGRVRRKIIASRLTKYNNEPEQLIDLSAAAGRPIILAPGQVEDDASVRLGCQDVNTNLKLLQAIRENRPDAYIIFKPHPDVVSGNRNGKVRLGDALKYCDAVIDNVSIATCLDAVDEVHTMTSLVGFEALMRKLPVTTYGLPFYAGWGLTEDRLEIPRRDRQLTLDELVAGALLLYPRYYDWDSGAFTDCEGVIDKLIESRNKLLTEGQDSAFEVTYLERQLRKLGKIVQGVLHGA